MRLRIVHIWMPDGEHIAFGFLVLDAGIEFEYCDTSDTEMFPLFEFCAEESLPV